MCLPLTKYLRIFFFCISLSQNGRWRATQSPISKSAGLATQVLETGQETNQQIMIIYLFDENAQFQVYESLS